MNHITFVSKSFPLAETAASPVYPVQTGRDWQRLHIVGEYEDVKTAFVDGAIYSHEWESQSIDEEGQPITEIISQDLSDFSIAGEIIDLRDGTFMVYMGKPTELELALAALDQVLLDALGGEE